MKGLTIKQQRVLDVIHEAIRRTGQPPTVREIGQEIGVAFQLYRCSGTSTRWSGRA